MNILSAEKISKSYSEKVLLDDISIGINTGEKIGLVGINGTGKSTFLKIIAGLEPPDMGRIITANDIGIEYLPQKICFEDGVTVLQQVFKGNSPVIKLVREYEYMLQKLRTNPHDVALSENLVSITQKMDNMGAWSVESDAKSILTQLGIFDFEAQVNKLSGGQKKRAAIASALINPSDLLILDEPTNHIDNDTVDWLEIYLNKQKGALLMVTHDRYFLERVANRIIELDKGKLYSYQANYSKYMEMKAEREELLQSSERKRQSLLRKELEWIRQGAQARSTKQKARIDRFEQLNKQKMPESNEDIEINVGSARLGKKIIEIEDISKSYSDKCLFKDFSYILSRNDRVGITGPNGAGKTTLLKIISGRLEPDKGRVETGATVKIGFFTQENEEMNENLRVIEYIREEAEYLVTDEGSISASQMLERFLFPPEVQWTPVSKLSGGERRRLYLLRVLMSAPNVLLLDEPTNDLDIQTLTILENYLDGFPGAVVAVSHDRYFLDRVVDRIFSFEGQCTVRQFEGNYSFYCESRRDSETGSQEEKMKEPVGKENNKDKNRKDRPVLKLSFKEQKEFEQIDDVISGLEGELKKINMEIDSSACDFVRLQELLLMKETLEGKLNTAIDRWTYLNELAEQIESNKKNR